VPGTASNDTELARRCKGSSRNNFRGARRPVGRGTSPRRRAKARETQVRATPRSSPESAGSPPRGGRQGTSPRPTGLTPQVVPLRRLSCLNGHAIALRNLSRITVQVWSPSLKPIRRHVESSFPRGTADSTLDGPSPHDDASTMPQRGGGSVGYNKAAKPGRDGAHEVRALQTIRQCRLVSSRQVVAERLPGRSWLRGSARLAEPRHRPGKSLPTECPALSASQPPWA
jgi:hypothetical protein